MSERDARLAELTLRLLDPEERAAALRELADSPDQREALDRVEEALGALSLSEPAVQPSDRVRELLLASVADDGSFAGFVERVAALFDLSAERTREILTAVDRVDTDAWIADRPGTRLFHLEGGPRVEAADCGLVHMEIGARYPAHRHKGDEWAFILRGRAEEEHSGVVWEPGDLVQRPAGSVHAFRVLGDEPFVFAVVLYEGIERP